MQKQCRTCGEVKDFSEYYFREKPSKPRLDCKICESKQHHEYKIKHREELAQKAREWYNKNNKRGLQVRRAYRETEIGKYRTWKTSARGRGIEWALSDEYLNSLPRTCYYTGEPLTFKSNLPNTISLDRLDSSKGYIEGNVVFCCWRVNQAKNNMSISEFLEMCRRIVQFRPI